MIMKSSRTFVWSSSCQGVCQSNCAVLTPVPARPSCRGLCLTAADWSWSPAALPEVTVIDMFGSVDHKIECIRDIVNSFELSGLDLVHSLCVHCYSGVLLIKREWFLEIFNWSWNYRSIFARVCMFQNICPLLLRDIISFGHFIKLNE